MFWWTPLPFLIVILNEGTYCQLLLHNQKNQHDLSQHFPINRPYTHTWKLQQMKNTLIFCWHCYCLPVMHSCAAAKRTGESIHHLNWQLIELETHVALTWTDAINYRYTIIFFFFFSFFLWKATKGKLNFCSIVLRLLLGENI